MIQALKKIMQTVVIIRQLENIVIVPTVSTLKVILLLII